MKKSVFSFIILSFFSFKVSAYQYDQGVGAQSPPPPPPPQRRYYNGPNYMDYTGRSLKLSLGVSTVSDGDFGSDELTYNTTRYLPFTIGYGIENGPFAFDLDFSVMSNKIKEVSGVPESGSVAAVSLMGNLYLRGFLSPYNIVYAGLGFGSIYVDISDGFSNSAYGSAWAVQGILGTEFRPNPRIGFYAEYKAITALALEMEDDFNPALYEYDYTNSSLNFGFRMYY